MCYTYFFFFKNYPYRYESTGGYNKTCFLKVSKIKSKEKLLKWKKNIMAKYKFCLWLFLMCCVDEIPQFYWIKFKSRKNK